MSAFNTKKADFLELIAGMEKPYIFSERCSVYVYDGALFKGLDRSRKNEIYRASTMTQAGYDSSVNQSIKFNKWISESAK